MDAGSPDPLDQPPPAPSLAARLAGAARSRDWDKAGRAIPFAARDARVGAVAALLLALAPLLTIGGAKLLAAHERAQAAQLRQRLSPRIAADAASDAARAELAPLLGRPGLAATIEALARALPAEAVLRRAGRDGRGLLVVQVLTPDPDRLRDALRRAEGFARLGDAGQAQGEGAMIVTLREVP